MPSIVIIQAYNNNETVRGSMPLSSSPGKGVLIQNERSEEPFITRKMGLAIAISNAMGPSWLKATLTLANIRASQGSPRKVAPPYAARQVASIKTCMEPSDLVHILIRYGHYIRCLTREDY